MNFTPYESFVDAGTPEGRVASKGDGRYASGAFTVLSVGPSRVVDIQGNGAASAAVDLAGNTALAALTFPIGLVQQASVQNSRQFNRVFELGSERSYFISGRTQGQLSLARTYYHGMSLLRALTQFVPGATTLPLAGTAAAGLAGNIHATRNYPGFKDLWLNLASDLFSQPVGLMLKVHDTNEEAIGATYMEGCYIPNHSFSTDSNGLLIQEQVGVMFERMVPVMVSGADTITAVAQAATAAAISAL